MCAYRIFNTLSEHSESSVLPSQSFLKPLPAHSLISIASHPMSDNWVDSSVMVKDVLYSSSPGSLR